MKKIYKLSEDACQRFMKSVKYSTDGKISKKVLKETMTTLSNVGEISKVANVSNIISPYFCAYRGLTYCERRIIHQKCYSF
jgi:hypothetical protein